MSVHNSARELQRRVSESAAAVQELFTLNSLNQTFSTQYRRRSLIAFLLYFIIGIGYYTGHENFSVLDSLYFSVTTVLTIGYGDLTPNTSYQRSFTSFYIILGILIISAFIGSVTEILYERHQESINRRVKKAAVKMKNFKENPNYQKVLDFLDVSDTARNDSSPQPEGTSGGIDRVSTIASNDSFSRLRQSFDHISTAIRGMSTTSTPPSQVASEKRMLAAMQKLNVEMFDEELKDIEQRAKRDFLVVFGIVLFGCLIMLGIEKWYFGEALYWAVVTITTVGFGDVVPQTNSGKVFTIVYSIVGCAVLASGINDLIRYPLIVKSKQNELRVMTQFGGELSEETLRGILNNDFFERIPDLRQKSNSINKGEFILMVLCMMNKVHDKDVIIVSKVFDMLDAGKEGVLSAQHIVSEIARAQAREEQQKLEEEKSRSNREEGNAHSKFHVKSLEGMKNSKTRDISQSSSGRKGKVGDHDMSNPLLTGSSKDDLSKPLVKSEAEMSFHGDSSTHSSLQGTYNPDELEAARTENDDPIEQTSESDAYY